MFKVGQVFNKNGKDYCVIDIINYMDKTFLLLSEQDDKISFFFYDVILLNNNYKLLKVKNQSLINELYSLYEERNS